MGRWKGEQRERKKAEGNDAVAIQDDGDSVSSSDEEDLRDQERQAQGGAALSTKQKVVKKAEEPFDKIENIRRGAREREERETQGDMGGAN